MPAPPSNASDKCNPLDYAQNVVHRLKLERDTWRAVAEQYKEAFDAQTARLKQLQDVCIATQAELENQRAASRRPHPKSHVPPQGIHHVDNIEANTAELPCGTATIVGGHQIGFMQQPPIPSRFLCFRRIEQFASQRDYATALAELDRLLRGPLTPEARLEGLLLKSNIMRQSEWVYDALAACSEALELCHRLEELRIFLPRVQYQRGICYYELSMDKQAQITSSDVSGEDDPTSIVSSERRDSCDEQLQVRRRSAFEAHRTVTEGFPAPSRGGSRLDVSYSNPVLDHCLTFCR